MSKLVNNPQKKVFQPTFCVDCASMDDAAKTKHEGKRISSETVVRRLQHETTIF